MADHDDGAAVSARLRRQEILYDPSRRFEFLIAEPALRWRPGRTKLMAAQITKLLNVATLENVKIGVLTFGSRTGPWHSFTLHDDRADGQDPIVRLELPHAGLTLGDPRDVQLYRDQFARWHEAALTGDAALDWLRQLVRELDTRGTGCVRTTTSGDDIHRRATMCSDMSSTRMRQGSHLDEGTQRMVTSAFFRPAYARRLAGASPVPGWSGLTGPEPSSHWMHPKGSPS